MRPIYRNWDEQDNAAARAEGGANNHIFRPTETSAWYVSYSPRSQFVSPENPQPETLLGHYENWPKNPKDLCLAGDHRKPISEAYEEGGEEAVLAYFKSQPDITPEAVKFVRKMINP
jgi:hypothetical protein